MNLQCDPEEAQFPRGIFDAVSSDRKYRVIDDVLILSGEDYVTNTKFSVQAKQMVIVSPNMRVVLEEVEEGV